MFQLMEDKNENIFALALCVERKQQRKAENEYQVAFVRFLYFLLLRPFQCIPTLKASELKKNKTNSNQKNPHH